MRMKTLWLLICQFLQLTTNHVVWTISLNTSDDAVVEMPLVTDNINAPLVASLDVSSLNKQLKHYIDRAISTAYTDKVKEIAEHSQDELKTTVSRFERMFRDLTENVTDLDKLENSNRSYTESVSGKVYLFFIIYICIRKKASPNLFIHMCWVFIKL